VKSRPFSPRQRIQQQYLDGDVLSFFFLSLESIVGKSAASVAYIYCRCIYRRKAKKAAAVITAVVLQAIAPAPLVTALDEELGALLLVLLLEDVPDELEGLEEPEELEDEDSELVSLLPVVAWVMGTVAVVLKPEAVVAVLAEAMAVDSEVAPLAVLVPTEELPELEAPLVPPTASMLS
jgi:hypothetical protein